MCMVNAFQSPPLTLREPLEPLKPQNLAVACGVCQIWARSFSSEDRDITSSCSQLTEQFFLGQ